MKHGHHKLAPGTVLTEDEYQEYLRSISVHRASAERRQIRGKVHQYGDDYIDKYTGLPVRIMEQRWDEVWMEHFLSTPIEDTGEGKELFLQITIAHSDYLIPIASLERMPMSEWSIGRGLMERIEGDIDNAIHSIHMNTGLDLCVVELTWDEYEDHKEQEGYGD
jgi:hypothetical protein